MMFSKISLATALLALSCSAEALLVRDKAADRFDAVCTSELRPSSLPAARAKDLAWYPRTMDVPGATGRIQFRLYLREDEPMGLTSEAAPPTAAPGNPGTTLGAQRLNVVLRALDILAAELDSPAPIKVAVTMGAGACDSRDWLLWSQAPTTYLWRTGEAAPPLGAEPDLFYIGPLLPAAVAPSYVYPFGDLPHIHLEINGVFDRFGCGPFADPMLNPPLTPWYYGLDPDAARPTDRPVLLPQLLHELVHHLGVLSSYCASANCPYGAGTWFAGAPDPYSRQLVAHASATPLTNLTAAQRTQLLATPGSVRVIGTQISRAMQRLGVPNATEGIPVVTAAAGALHHLDVPGLLMSRTLDPAVFDQLDVAAALLHDMGWPAPPATQADDDAPPDPRASIFVSGFDGR